MFNMDVVKDGSEVEILYRVKLEDGTVVDSTEERGPFKFYAGRDGVIEGVSKSVIGMKVGDKRAFSVTPEDGYGKYDEALRMRVPLNKASAFDGPRDRPGRGRDGAGGPLRSSGPAPGEDHRTRAHRAAQ